MGSCWKVSLQWKELALSSFLFFAGWKVEVKFGAKVVMEDRDLADGGLSRAVRGKEPGPLTLLSATSPGLCGSTLSDESETFNLFVILLFWLFCHSWPNLALITTHRSVSGPVALSHGSSLSVPMPAPHSFRYNVLHHKF